MISTNNHECTFACICGERIIYLLYDQIHLPLLWLHEDTTLAKRECYPPFWPANMSNMIEPKIMQNQDIPIFPCKLIVQMSCHIVVYLRIILSSAFLLKSHTDTKKLLVPSDRTNSPGNNFIQVSSPYITNCAPDRFAC